MSESNPIEFIETREGIGCRDHLVAHYGKIGSSAVRAALCVASTPVAVKDERISDDQPAVLRDETGAD